MNLPRKRYTILVNTLTLLRIPLTLLFGFFCIRSEYSGLYCCIIFLFVILTDLLDGILARRHHVTSTIGAWLDVSCDFFFIIMSCLFLFLIHKMHILFLIIISFKFLEFLMTSILSKRFDTKQKTLLFDPFGRYLALLFYGLPIISLLLNDLFPTVQTSFLIVIAVASIISSAIRIRYCIRISISSSHYNTNSNMKKQ